MLLTIRFLGAERCLPSALLGEEDRHEEFWFGQGFAWADPGEGSIHLSLLVDVPRIVARTKSREREARFSVGFCDPYAYSASGLMGLFVARLRLRAGGQERCAVQGEFLSYPDRQHSDAIARRVLAPLGYEVEASEGKLRFRGERNIGQALKELPAALLALDRRTRLFLSEEELGEIKGDGGDQFRSHPAGAVFNLALQGRDTPLRYLLPPGHSPGIERSERPAEASPFNDDRSILSDSGPAVRLAPAQRSFAQAVFSRMNIDPCWLIYLPAGVSSVQGRNEDGSLERPEDALAYYRDEQIEKVVVEEKHMGSRAIVVLCRTLEVAKKRFGSQGELPGCAYTRNGRRFFRDEDTQAVFLERLGAVLERANFWKRFATDWVLLDGEIKPWAVKAAESSEESGLVEAGRLVLSETGAALARAECSVVASHWMQSIERESTALGIYDGMFKRYRLESADLAALKFAPFHLLATEGQTFFHRSHLWHMEVLTRLARTGEEFVIPTRYEVVDTDSPETWKRVLRWWEELSREGSEGLMVKPLPFVPRGRRGLSQPALKCRSREHLRLVYGPRYDSPDAFEALLARGALFRRRNKHRRILRQFALSMEAVTRFVQGIPLSAVHESVFGILSQEVAPGMSA